MPGRGRAGSGCVPGAAAAVDILAIGGCRRRGRRRHQPPGKVVGERAAALERGEIAGRVEEAVDGFACRRHGLGDGPVRGRRDGNCEVIAGAGRTVADGDEIVAAVVAQGLAVRRDRVVGQPAPAGRADQAIERIVAVLLGHRRDRQLKAQAEPGGVALTLSIAPTSDTAINSANYTFNPPATITAVKIDPVKDFIIHLVADLKAGTAYTVTIANLLTLAGDGVDPACDSAPVAP